MDNAASGKMSDPAAGPKVLLLFRSAVGIIEMAKSLRVPMGLSFLATYLISNGIPAIVENFSSLSYAEQVARLTEYHPKYIGLSMLTLNRFTTIELVRVIRKVLPDTKIIVGGPHASFLAEHILMRVPEIDCIVCGEGEESLFELIKTWERSGDLGNVQGIVYRKRKDIIKNPHRPLMTDLSALPHPAEHFAYDTLSTSRGCPFQCAFCSSSQYWGRMIRYHSPEWVADEIELLYRKHGIREISFNDDLFTLDKKRLISICREIINRRLFIRFRCMSRVNTLCRERLEWLKKAGCTRIDFGVESGSEKMLKAMGKGTDVGQIREAFRMTRNAGIGTGCFLIVGFPGEDDKSIALTKQLVRDIRPTFCDISSFAMFPDSPIYHKLLKVGVLSPNIWFDIKAHTLFVMGENEQDRFTRYVHELRNDYAENEPRYAFTLSDRLDAFKHYTGIGHTAVDLANALSHYKEHEKALELLGKTVEMEPDNPFLWYTMGALCLYLGRTDLALEMVQTFLHIQPKNYENLLLAANIFMAQGLKETALEQIEAAIGSRPEKIEAYIEKGARHAAAQSWSEAAAAYTQALRIDPYWPPLKDALQRCEAHLTTEA